MFGGTVEAVFRTVGQSISLGDQHVLYQRRIAACAHGLRFETRMRAYGVGSRQACGSHVDGTPYPQSGESPMKVSALMTKTVHTCSPTDTLDHVARIMWENDVGAVPVVDENGRVTGMITDRDLCMAAYTQGKALSEIPVSIAASTNVIAARPDDSLDDVHDRMRSGRIRRMPIVGERGEPIGMVSVGDLARGFAGVQQTDGLGADAIAYTLAAISRPHAMPIEPVHRSEDGHAFVPPVRGSRA
jgi:CBS domain-containing protein